MHRQAQVAINTVHEKSESLEEASALCSTLVRTLRRSGHQGFETVSLCCIVTSITATEDSARRRCTICERRFQQGPISAGEAATFWHVSSQTCPQIASKKLHTIISNEHGIPPMPSSNPGLEHSAHGGDSEPFDPNAGLQRSSRPAQTGQQGTSTSRIRTAEPSHHGCVHCLVSMTDCASLTSQMS